LVFARTIYILMDDSVSPASAAFVTHVSDVKKQFLTIQEGCDIASSTKSFDGRKAAVTGLVGNQLQRLQAQHWAAYAYAYSRCSALTAGLLSLTLAKRQISPWSSFGCLTFTLSFIQLVLVVPVAMPRHAEEIPVGARRA